MPSTDKYSVTIRPLTAPISQGDVVRLDAEPSVTANVRFSWDVKGAGKLDSTDQQTVQWDTSGLAVGNYPIAVTATWDIGGGKSVSHTAEVPVEVQGRAAMGAAIPPVIQQQVSTNTALPVRVADPVPVTLQRTGARETDDIALWVVIRKATDAIGFDSYATFMDLLFCKDSSAQNEQFTKLFRRRALPYTDAEAYRVLKVATEAFLMTNCGVAFNEFQFNSIDLRFVKDNIGITLDAAGLDRLWRQYRVDLNGDADATIPYLLLIQQKLGDLKLLDIELDPGKIACPGLIRDKLTNPPLIELIWSYWQEEGMLVQSMNAISMRFQNIRSSTLSTDPLAMMEIDALRPVNNLLWGWIQDEQHRLTMARRVLEYEHSYGIRLYGKAVPKLRAADARSKFVEAFHNLLYLCSVFYRSDDDTTVVADGFPVLNALREVHLLLTEGAHNQYGDLPTTDRIEKLMAQWILSRPEFREFLPTRTMTALPEPWMDRVDAMKTLQRWTDTSILHFNNLAKFGEQLLLSIRFGNWLKVDDPAQAANFARFWRSAVQGYIHSYRSATSVDLRAEPSAAEPMEKRYAQPWVHLKNRLDRQAQKRA